MTREDWINSGDEAILVNYLKTHLGPNGDKLVTPVFNDGEVQLMHVSIDPKLTCFIPMVSKKLYPGENTQIPRTSTGPSIVQCMVGYGGFYQDEKKGEYVRNWNGVYHVYEPEWDVAFIPAKKMMGDIEYTKEHWLLYYKPDQYKRPCKRIAEFFVHSLTKVLKGDNRGTEYNLVIRVCGRHCYLMPGVSLEKGFYKVSLRDYYFPFIPVLDENVFIEKIDEKKYRHMYMLRTGKIK